MFNLKRPCKDCPFVKGSLTNQTLASSRIDSIIDGLKNNGTFICHKTIDYSKEFEEIDDGEEVHVPTEKNQLCAGSLLYLEREGIHNQMMQVAYRLGLYQPNKMKDMNKIIDTIEEE